MKITEEFDLFEGDNAYDDITLYEMLSMDPYADVPGLDINLEWDDPRNKISFGELDDLDEDYSEYPVDIHPGDILLASVRQMGDNVKYEYEVRPFLLIYANASRAYGFQITTKSPYSLRDYLVPVTNWQQSGLAKPSNFTANFVRGVRYRDIVARVGRITHEDRDALISKMREIFENVDGRFDSSDLRDAEDLNRLSITINNLARIAC